MKVSEIYTAKKLKIKFDCKDAIKYFKSDVLVKIESTEKKSSFLLTQYGLGADGTQPKFCNTTPGNVPYILNMLDGDSKQVYRCMFSVEIVEKDNLIVQSYMFKSVNRYYSPINIIIPDEILEKYSEDKLREYYVCEQLNMPAVFCLNYKNKEKQKTKVRFLGGRHCLVATNTKQGIIAEKVSFLKNIDDLPVDLYIAPEIKFVRESDSVSVNEELSKELDKISNSASYFARWELYNELNKKMIEDESEEFGFINYSSCYGRQEEKGVSYEFVIDQNLDDSFKGKELGALELGDNAQEKTINIKANRKNFKYVGQIKNIYKNKITTYSENTGDREFIPRDTNGVLCLYTAGDYVVMARRDAARRRMLQNESPIKYIVPLIEDGVNYKVMGRNKGVTEKLKKNFKRAAQLNIKQREALELAINTPDIAVIQGPPGTGKTTVIKAICERFREIFEQEEMYTKKCNPEYSIRSPKILISSFQNDAVDNAISSPLPGDIPAYRKTSKRGKVSSQEQYQKSLEKWYTGVKRSLEEGITDSTILDFTNKKKEFSDEIFSYKNTGEDIKKAADIINKYLSYIDIPYPKNLVEVAKAIVGSAFRDKEQSTIENPIVKKLESQRLTKESFSDDGVRNAINLYGYISIDDDLDIPKEISEAIYAVCDSDFSNEEFEEYVKSINILKEKYCQRKVSVDIKDKEQVNKCLFELNEAFSRHYLKSLDTIEGKKSLILGEFLDRLSQDYESLVKEYSMTTAATCQTSLDVHREVDKVYDLVVIDEAARANPLDIFIPISMGKKVILVGDHKQLPHMLEPDIIAKLKADKNFNDYPDIEKSLFERLFDMLSKEEYPRALQLTEQFRMHPEICRFVSEAFYDGVLQTGKGIDIENYLASKDINNGEPLVYVNVTYARGSESGGVSKSREAESEIIGKDIRHILDIEPDATIGIITFYSAQSKLISANLDSILNEEEKNNIEIGTVDAFQGKEFDYVLLSCVRSNQPRNGAKPVVGFLEKPNRLCVAFSRSIKQLAVYGDADTLNQIPCFAKLYDICKVEKGGCYREY